MFKSINGLLISVILSSTLAPCSYAAVALIGHGSTASVQFRAVDTIADYFTFSELSAEVASVSISRLSQRLELSEGPFSDGTQVSTGGAPGAGSLAISQDALQSAKQVGALQDRGNLFQVNKKGLADALSDSGTLSSPSTSGLETWAMFLVGAMLVGYQLHRKQRGIMALKPVPAVYSH